MVENLVFHGPGEPSQLVASVIKSNLEILPLSEIAYKISDAYIRHERKAPILEYLKRNMGNEIEYIVGFAQVHVVPRIELQVHSLHPKVASGSLIGSRRIAWADVTRPLDKFNHTTLASALFEHQGVQALKEVIDAGLLQVRGTSLKGYTHERTRYVALHIESNPCAADILYINFFPHDLPNCGICARPLACTSVQKPS
jgi:hypothetical protein